MSAPSDPSPSKSAELPRLRCHRAQLGSLTANPDAGPWPGIAPIELRETVTGASPEQSTTLRVAWNDHELRVLFCAIDSNPWATHTERDAPLYDEEVFEVFLDPVGDLKSYFEFEVNPLNAVLDLIIRRNRSGLVKNFKWQCDNLRTAVLRTADGWNGEFSIPFRSLIAAPPQPGDRWRANFYRIDRPTGREWELSAWSPTGQPKFHMPECFGILEFAG